MKTEVASKHGRKWVYGPLDPGREERIEFMALAEPNAEDLKTIDFINRMAMGAGTGGGGCFWDLLSGRELTAAEVRHRSGGIYAVSLRDGVVHISGDITQAK